MIVVGVKGHDQILTDAVGMHIKNDLRLAGLGDPVDADRQIAFEIFFHFVQCNSV